MVRICDLQLCRWQLQLCERVVHPAGRVRHDAERVCLHRCDQPAAEHCDHVEQHHDRRNQYDDARVGERVRRADLDQRGELGDVGHDPERSDAAGEIDVEFVVQHGVEHDG